MRNPTAINILGRVSATKTLLSALRSIHNTTVVSEPASKSTSPKSPKKATKKEKIEKPRACISPCVMSLPTRLTFVPCCHSHFTFALIATSQCSRREAHQRRLPSQDTTICMGALCLSLLPGCRQAQELARNAGDGEEGCYDMARDDRGREKGLYCVSTSLLCIMIY
jgi:hypothetical protein